MRLLTDTEYVDSMGLKCPNCHGVDGVEACGSAEPNGLTAYQDARCRNCGAKWVDQYQLIGYVDLERE